ncbi:phosphoribosylanthranilate isomerase [Rubrimonas cliftonensis]|uniref:N-(5'-phosphoribosyl)anthranilate isomerase n=1 Tax=Rubrimonas cliftonensis TaxID=89524 RepID=A0A1H4DWN9_9RHOB|nr:phosphoribosylanthranilate isomerase [Rubrimonas cliftonensis]SEA77161.1 phosphoribosylanthranilate isomerase [Rubrimonas cliftonensis]
MDEPVRVKICGVRTPLDLEACVAARVDYVGLNLFPPSPRYVAPDALRALAAAAPPGLCKVALVVDPDAAALEALAALPVDMVQLHGREDPARVAAIRARLGLPVMKTVAVAGPQDVAAIAAFEAVADQILVEGRPPEGADLPGGVGAGFDWRLVAGRRWARPWMLAGGLKPDNVTEAVAVSGARQVDVASGVERARGVKDAALIAAFAAAARR